MRRHDGVKCKSSGASSGIKPSLQERLTAILFGACQRLIPTLRQTFGHLVIAR